MTTKNCFFVEQVTEYLLIHVYITAKTYKHSEYIDKKAKNSLSKSDYFIRLAIESLIKWAEWFPLDPKDNESDFKLKFGLLLNSSIQLPNNFEFYSKADEEKGALTVMKEELMKISLILAASKKRFFLKFKFIYF